MSNYYRKKYFDRFRLDCVNKIFLLSTVKNFISRKKNFKAFRDLIPWPLVLVWCYWVVSCHWLIKGYLPWLVKVAYANLRILKNCSIAPPIDGFVSLDQYKVKALSGANCRVDLLFIEHMSYLSLVKLMYGQPILHLTHGLVLCIQIGGTLV